MCAIWPKLTLIEGTPQKQVLKGENLLIQTEFKRTTVTLLGDNSFSQGSLKKLDEAFEIWRKELQLTNVSQVSTLTTFSKEFKSMGEANASLFSFNMARWPNSKIFDQPLESDMNGLEILFRFQDDNSYSTLKLKAEQTNYSASLDPNFVDEPNIRETKNELLIMFDRGLLGVVDATKFKVDDWFKGYLHVLRRDINKLIKV